MCWLFSWEFPAPRLPELPGLVPGDYELLKDPTWKIGMGMLRNGMIGMCCCVVVVSLVDSMIP
jgi:hypothetical protein